MGSRGRGSRKRAGIALVTVLIAGLVAIVILTVLNLSVLGEMRSGGGVSTKNRLAQAADGVSEQARLQLVLDYSTSKQTVTNYLKTLDAGIARGTPKGGTVNLDPAAGLRGVWQVKSVSKPHARYGWVEVHATAWQGNNNQTVVRRISFGRNNIFDLALLTETVNCMFCHLQVNGDVGSYKFLRPGFGTEGKDGQGSGGANGGSQINGTVYVAPCPAPAACPGTDNISNDDTDLAGDPKTINGTKVTGEVRTKYNEPQGKLPRDEITGTPQFPPIEREVAEANAQGSITGGIKVGVAKGGQLTTKPLSPNVSRVDGIYDGNLVLVGTETDPIQLDGDVYIKGDVIIKGVVTGRGAIYSERNTYIAGNLTVKKVPDVVGAGVCAGLSPDSEEDKNTCAQRNIAAGRDEVRLAARGSTILGDYTERDASGAKLPFDQAQAADYYRKQFGFSDAADNHYYDRITGDELYKDADNKFYNVERQEVPLANVVTKSSKPNTAAPDPDDAYSYSFRPGSVTTGGGFSQWVSDDFYKSELLGDEKLTYNTWRTELPPRQTGESDADFEARITQALKAARLPEAEAAAIASRYASNGSDYGQDFAGGRWYYSGGTLRVIIDAEQTYPAQVSRVDAFIYSNWRIAGKTGMRPLAVNGGMIAKELGVLAPGRTVQTWWAGERYAFLNDANSPNRGCNNPNDPYYVPNTTDCALTVNYDYRLKNGGFGYDLIKGALGQTLSWRLSASDQERVR